MGNAAGKVAEYSVGLGVPALRRYGKKALGAPKPPDLTTPPSLIDEKAAAMIQGIRSRRKGLARPRSTQFTGPLGLNTPPVTAQKTLLGL